MFVENEEEQSTATGSGHITRKNQPPKVSHAFSSSTFSSGGSTAVTSNSHNMTDVRNAISNSNVQINYYENTPLLRVYPLLQNLWSFIQLARGGSASPNVSEVDSEGPGSARLLGFVNRGRLSGQSADLPSRQAYQIYHDHLFGKRPGSPLWTPGPDISYPSEYRCTGVGIGDVGIIDATGGFDYLFNILKPSTHPINVGRVPEYFIPLPESMVRDIVLPNIRKRVHGETVVTSTAFRRGGIEQSGYIFESSDAEGAVLITPTGIHAEMLRNDRIFDAYIMKHLEGWYQHANRIEHSGGRVKNGDIHLVYGTEKAQSWGMAAFSNQDKRYNVRLEFTSNAKSPGSSAYSNMWTSVGHGTAQVGPSDQETICPLLSDEKWKRISEGMTVLNESDPWNNDQMSSGPHGHAPSKTNKSTPGSSSSTATWSNKASTYAISHPSRMLNSILFELAPGALIALSNDRDWEYILDQAKSFMPVSPSTAPEELLLRHIQKACILSDGMVYLDYQNNLNYRTNTEQNVTLDTEPLQARRANQIDQPASTQTSMFGKPAAMESNIVTRKTVGTGSGVSSNAIKQFDSPSVLPTADSKPEKSKRFQLRFNRRYAAIESYSFESSEAQNTSALSITGSFFKTPESVDRAAYDPNRLFALIIGINKYASRIGSLQGAVADAEAVKEFLTGDLRVPQDNIAIIKDEEATADAIKTNILSFASNTKIQNDDPILVYYAGYGANANIPESWSIYGEKATRKVKLLLPYDFNPNTTNSPKGQGIVDRTLSTLLCNVAAAKGNNILVILDSCHFASGTRTAHERLRGHDLPCEYRIYDKLDVSDVAFIEEHSPIGGTDRARGLVPEYLANGNMRSHVLLAACEENESAGERHGRGNFTTTLLEFLRSVELHKTTYMDIFLNLPDLPNPKQHPRCEGVYQNRLIFSSTIPSRTTVFPLILEDGMLSIEAGESSGITALTEMTIHTHPAAFSVVDTARVVTLRPFSAKLQVLSGANIQPAKKKDYRFARRGHRDSLMKIYVDNSTAAMLRLDNKNSAHEPLYDVLFVDNIENCDIALDRKQNSVGFIFFDEIHKRYRITDTRRIPDTYPEELHRLLEAAWFFYAHLRSGGRPSSMKTVSVESIAGDPGRQAQPALKFEIEFHQVVADFGEDLDLVYNPVNVVNLYKKEKEEIHITANKVGPDGNDAVYGLKITNGTSYGVYMWVFFFNCRDLSISEWYRPAANNAPCLNSKTDFVEIGRGAGANGAYAFTLDKGETRGVGFLKIFFSTKFDDLSSVAQTSPLSEARSEGRPSNLTSGFNFWGSRIIPVIQTR